MRPDLPRAVLLDLDGTLADTAPDLAGAINALLIEQGRGVLPYEAIRPHASHGSPALVRLAFGIEQADAAFEPLRIRFLEIYRSNLARETRLFAGMETVLATLEQKRIAWGIVTNKPAWLTEPLLEQLGILNRAVCVVSGDTTPNRKPHPDPLLHAAKLLGRTPSQCVYVGDAERDITAARKAGMATLVAAFGYIGSDDAPEAWGADAVISTPLEILDWLGVEAASSVG